jgi:hypothetical protein
MTDERRNLKDRRTPSNELLDERLAHLDSKLGAILEQTTKTNGRVDNLESWRDRVSGALIPISILSPVFAGLIVSYLSR